MLRFLEPSRLYFLALAAVPVALYLLLRLRRNEVDWGATYILRLTLRSRRTRSRWRQAAVVALRTLLLAALAAALARPFGARPTGDQAALAHPVGSLHRVVVVDNSMSMLAAHGTTHRLGAAHEMLADLLAAAAPGDTCHVVAMSPPAGGHVAARAVPCPISLADARRVAAEIQPAASPADLSAALRAALGAVRDSAAAHRQLVILSDLARVDHPSLGDYEIFGAILAKLDVSVLALNFASHEVGNVALEMLSAGGDIVLARQPTNVYLEAMNYSVSPSGDLLVQFLVDGGLVREEVVALPAGHRRTMRFAVSLPAGRHSLQCRLAPDAYAADNRIRRFVRAAGSLDVLVAAPAGETQEPFRKENEFLRRLLGATAPFELKVRAVGEAQLLPQSFRNVDVAFLCGLAKLPTATRDALEAFVRRGGGVVLSVAPHLDANAFNHTHERLLPARLGEPFRAAFDEQRYLSIQPPGAAILALREFTGQPGIDLSAGRVYNHFRLRGPRADDPPAATRTLLTLSNGDPLLVQRRYGKGVVLLWATTQGAAWNSLVVHQAHLPLVYRLMAHAASFREPPLNVLPGEPLICPVPAGTEAFMTTPGKKLVSCPVLAAGGRAYVRFERTDAPGDYELRNAADEPLASFSVARPAGESDLRTLTDEEARHFERALHTRITRSVAELREAISQGGAGAERAGWLLIAAVAMLLLDGLLTRLWLR